MVDRPTFSSSTDRFAFHHHARPSKASASNFKLLKGGLKWQTLLPLLGLDERRLIFSDLRRYAVSRSDAISRHSVIGTTTAVGLPASLETIWISASTLSLVYSFWGLTHWVAGCRAPARLGKSA